VTSVKRTSPTKQHFSQHNFHNHARRYGHYSAASYYTSL